MAQMRPLSHGVSMPDTFEPFRVTAAGAPLLSRGRVRSSQFRSDIRGTRIDGRAENDHATRARSAALILETDCFLCGPSAAALLGLPLPAWLERGPVHIGTKEGGSHIERGGTVGRRLDITENELVTIESIPMTSPARTFCDLARDLRMPDLCAVGDAVITRWGTSPDELRATMQRRLRYSGKVAARRAIPLLSPLAESPQESRTRIIIIDAGLPAPVPQFVVVDHRGHFIARVDFAYPELRIAIEYDGDVHRDRIQFAKDAARRTRLREAGWYVVEVTAEDVRKPELLLAKVRAALRVQRSH